ncbi:unnamed protein product [Cyclocybe aegerita]|uniref:DNA (cytosine-5-)-methyltransferase n=1 Tax=Cyclocybe aegerita TaxID=1973307 RepID=A0A8S0W7F3_CYCAE|nr:unnamed protein product [Cyclocybe aegerita]
MARRRSSAFDVSFPEEAGQRAAEHIADGNNSAPQSRSSSVASNSSLGKRKSDEPGRARAPKLQQLPKDAYYRKNPKYLLESKNLIIDGEDPDLEEGEDEKPIRELYDFYVFDPIHRNELVSLVGLEQDDGVERQFEAAGKVRAHFASDEDEGQEEEEGEVQPTSVHLTAIMRYTVDYTRENEPFYIETEYAWYILKTPAEEYKPFYQHFYNSRRIAQLVISWALKRPQESLSTFLGRFTSRVDMFGRTYLEQDIWNSVPEIQECVQDEPESRRIRSAPFVKHILRNAPPISESSRPPPRREARNKHLPKNKASIGNPDLAVLKAENQNTTHVTPRIAKLVQGLVRESMEVVGPPPPPVNKAEVEAERKRAFEQLCRLHTKAKKLKKNIEYNKQDRIEGNLEYCKVIKIEYKPYMVGDIVLVPRDPVLALGWPTPKVGDKIYDFFWFGKIQSISPANQNAHLHWFWHGSETAAMQEVAHPQELFLGKECHWVSLHNIVDKVTVHFCPKDGVNVKPNEFFYKFTYDAALAAYTSMDAQQLELIFSQMPPDNCLPCLLKAEQRQMKSPQELKDEQGFRNGVSFGGKHFHLEDFVLYHRQDKGDGPADIGYITGVEFRRENTMVTVRKVGRIASLGDLLPKRMLRDERHLYLTRENTTVDVQDLIKVIYVPCTQSFLPPHVTVEDWLDLSHNHFYVKYTFPRLRVKSWNDRTKITWPKLGVCTPCCRERLKGRKAIYAFLQQAEKKRLSTLDLFGGVGAFSRGLSDGSGCLEVTHAVEISPSAAKTFKRNSPQTVVYNQCANIMLRYAIKSYEGHDVETPKQLFNGEDLPEPPEQGYIKVIVAGFPCQSHSTLNMYKKEDDVKSNLILTTLSFVDFYRPTYAFFENVPGFLNFHLNAERANEHGAAGEIERGGLKLLVRAMIDMGYQVRHGLLQAGHYGTPQRRMRFFLIAAKEGHMLPAFPQPTHDFPDTHEIKNRDGRVIPVRATRGTAAHPFVTVEDAIGDLPRFDWNHPRPDREPLDKRDKRRRRAATVPSFECKVSEQHCGFKGRIGYYSEPKTTFQHTARLNPTTDIQHYTKCLIPKKVERVVSIPLKTGADYISLPNEQLEWQIADPMSSIARNNYKRGIYGRLDKDGVFPTTVTNVDPTAKQSRCLHPYLYRIVTVRELARSQGFPDSFNFEAIGGNVVTMHRQIGNAVPLPVAHALGRQLRKSLFRKWEAQRAEAIQIDDDEDENDDHHNENPHHMAVVAPGGNGSDDMDIYE